MLYEVITRLPTDIDGINVKAILEKINSRLERLLDRDHTIGHAFFMKAKNIDDLASVFLTKVIPQLQEYFYGDGRKIGMVLGQGLVNSQELPADEWPSGVITSYSIHYTKLYEILSVS